MNGLAKKAATAPAIQRTAQVQLAASFGPFSITDWLGRIVIPPSLGAPFPTPQFLPQVAPTSIGSSIKNIYNAVEPWVRYGFDIAAYVNGNPVAGNPGKGGLVGAIKRVTDPLTGGISGAKRRRRSPLGR